MRPFVKRLLLFSAGILLGAAMCTLWIRRAGIGEEMEIVEEKPGFPGYFYKPAKGGPFPAIVFLHGSDGGNGDFWRLPGEHLTAVGRDGYAPTMAREYARRGFVTFALCYFDCAHHEGFESYPPKELSKVAIDEITGRAIEWIRSHSSVAGRKVGLLGMSRGAEHALLLASTCSSSSCPDATVALSPSDYAAREFTKKIANQIGSGEEPTWIDKPAWTFSNKLIPVGTAIELENYTKPWLLSFFEKDSAWSHNVDPKKLLSRLQRKGVSVETIDVENTSKLPVTTGSSSERIALRFNFEGHVFPPESAGSNLRGFQRKLITEFFKKTLQN